MRTVVVLVIANSQPACIVDTLDRDGDAWSMCGDKFGWVRVRQEVVMLPADPTLAVDSPHCEACLRDLRSRFTIAEAL